MWNANETSNRPSAVTRVLRGCVVLLVGGTPFAQTLVPGEPVHGTISLQGQRDTYTFGAQQDDWFELRLVDTNASTFTPRIEVFNPRGRLVAADASPDVAVVFPLKVGDGGLQTQTPAGTYTVVVTNEDGVRSRGGDYTLHFVKSPGPTSGGELVDGVTIFGEVERGELDSYSFAFAGGQTVTGTITPLDRPFPMRAELFHGSGRSEGVGGTFSFTTAVSPGGVATVVVSDGSAGAAGTGRYKLVVHGILAAPPYAPSVFLPGELLSDPLLLDDAGNPGLGPRIGDPAEPFNVSLDCTVADAPGTYALAVSLGGRGALTTPLGWLYLDGPRALRTLGRHARSVVSWFPEPTGLPLPNDVALVGTTYTVQGVCGGIAGGRRLSTAIRQTIGG